MHVKESHQNSWQCIRHSLVLLLILTYFQNFHCLIQCNNLLKVCGEGNIVWILLKIQLSLHEEKDFKNRLRIENKLLL